MSRAIVCDCCGDFASCPPGRQPKLPEDWIKIVYSCRGQIDPPSGWVGEDRLELCPSCRFIDPRDRNHQDHRCPHKKAKKP